MKLVFQNLESHLELNFESVTVLEIWNRSLFSGILCSAFEGYGPETAEPAVLVDDVGHEMNVKNMQHLVFDPVSFDLNNKFILGELFKKVVALVREDETLFEQMEKKQGELSLVIEESADSLMANTGFLGSWDVVKYCKALGFGVDSSGDLTLFDKLIHLMDLAFDLFPEKILCFANLKLFLTATEYAEFAQKALSNKLCILLYETTHDDADYQWENKLVVDEDYLENNR